MAKNVALVVQAAVLHSPVCIRQTLIVRGCPLFDKTAKILAFEGRRAEINPASAIVKNEWHTPFI